MAKLLPYKNGYYLWHYLPSVPGGIIFTILFFLLTALHAWRMVRNRFWFCIPFLIGGIFETIGYIFRAIAHDRTDKLIPYVLQSVLLLVAPALYAATIYMVLGRVIRALPGGEACSVIRTRWLTTIFVIGDVFSFLVQASGAGLMVKDGSMKTGENIVVAGLVIQIIWFGLFGVTAIIFHLRYRSKSAVTASYGGHSGPTAAELPWQRLLMMLYIVSVFIMIRSIFRVIEYVMGSDGYLLQHEWTLYVFDSILMVGVMAVYFVWYPSGLQPQVISTPASMEMGVPREEDERNKQHYGRH